MNQLEQPSSKKPELSAVDSEKVFLVRNFLQLYHAQRKTGVDAELYSPNKEENEIIAEETRNFGSEFHDWIDTEEGKFVVENYTKNHSLEEVGKFEDMEDVMKKYEAYCAKTLH
ncbi:MAG: hypothetical protein LiPW30_514 [Parcubacteria group bacterium LiPW_30]|nr:MAG: hypothetical protein LiPW30_514 [Parcubacteria group bacterium LiPW_30]